MLNNSIEILKQSLNKIALDVHDADDEEFEIYTTISGGSDYSDWRNSHKFAYSKSASRSPISNGIGIDSPSNPEIERYKAEIKRLQESESEIKAISVNYAALLKEKEDQITRLHQENDSLKRNLDSTKEALNVSRSESSKTLTNSLHVLKGSGDKSPNRQHRSAIQGKFRNVGNHVQNGIFSKQDGVSNGVSHFDQADPINGAKEKELADLLEEKTRSMAAMQATYESQIKQLRLELEKERDKVANAQIKLQEEHKLNESVQEQLRTLKMGETDMSKIRSELNDKISENRRLQMELSRRGDVDSDDAVKDLKRKISTLEKENADLKIEKNELVAALEMSRNASPDKASRDGGSSGSVPGKEETELSLQNFEKELKETRRQRDKALQELARLKQHLLAMESEESEKMDEDSKIIEKLRGENEYLKSQLSHLEKALKQAEANQEEVKIITRNEILKSREMIEDLNKKLANCMSVIDSKNVELLNLQTALGQYFAEIEAKEQLEQNLALAREEIAKLSELLKAAEQGTETLKREKEEILANLSHTERTLAEGKNRVNKLEQDNSKLRRALEQSMTRLNRMSVDSDFLVDRRIVIKLLVTYFQRNHSKEVLDLMVRMLGFSDEDKQRIGVAQQGGKGVVRGVLGLPGRLVGGILGGGSADAHANAASENQSFADLWVDFLLKENDERERREITEEKGGPAENSQGISPIRSVGSPSAIPNTAGAMSGIPRPNFSPIQSYSSPFPSQGNLRPFEHSDNEFSTVPLTSSDSSSRISRLLNP